MAELAANIVGIISAGTKVALVLSQLASELGSAGHEMRMIGGEVRSFCAVLKTLGETLEKLHTSQYYNHCSDMIRDMTKASSEMYTEILDAVDSLRSMTGAKDGRDSKFGIGRRMQWVVFHKPKIVMLRAAMEAYKSNLSLMLNTLSTAEKVTRRIPLSNRKDLCLDAEHAQALLKGLELDHQASMIDLQQAERQLNDYGMKSFEQLLPSSIDVVSPKDDGVPLSDGKLWHVSDGLLNQARDEVENIRRSLAPDSASDNASIRDQVSRHSRRTSKLLEGPQKRLSQRWSTKSPPLSCDNLPTHTDECRPSTDSTFILTDQNLQSLKVKNDLTQANDYRIFRQWLLQQPYEARVHIMEALLRDASVTRTKEQSKPQSTSAQGITAPIEIKAVHVSQDKSGISAQCVLVLWAVHKQWKKHCDSFPINESWKSKFGLAIDLRKRGLHSLSWKVVDMLHHRLTEKLKLSWNRLATLPENMFLCSYLRHLDLSHNKFKEIPESILCLRFLTHLDMCENQLCSIPDDISRLESLKSLLVANNNIRVIPPAIGKMRSLVLLNYDYNPVLVPSQHTKDLSQSYEAIRDDSHAAFDSSRIARLKLVLNTQNDYIPTRSSGHVPFWSKRNRFDPMPSRDELHPDVMQQSQDWLRPTPDPPSLNSQAQSIRTHKTQRTKDDETPNLLRPDLSFISFDPMSGDSLTHDTLIPPITQCNSDKVHQRSHSHNITTSSNTDTDMAPSGLQRRISHMHDATPREKRSSTLLTADTSALQMSGEEAADDFMRKYVNSVQLLSPVFPK